MCVEITLRQQGRWHETTLNKYDKYIKLYKYCFYYVHIKQTDEVQNDV